jgi:L-ornithine Nalpha-acyltransferase
MQQHVDAMPFGWLGRRWPRPAAAWFANLRALADRAIAAQPEAPTLGRLGGLEIRLARSRKDAHRAQRLRYRVFYEEMDAVPDPLMRLRRRDVDAFDAHCDHLLVLDHAARENAIGRRARVVGTYRLLRQQAAERLGGFYTEREFAIERLIARRPDLNFLELGRSCVLPPYRNKRTVELLWHGIWSYVLEHGVDVMFGCASLEGVDPNRLALPLSFLHHFARAPEPWRVSALGTHAVEMDRIPKAAIDPKLAMRELPPLIKGYLRLGAFVGDGAVVDCQFGTTDVLIVLPVSAISARYVQHFGAGAERHAA